MRLFFRQIVVAFVSLAAAVNPAHAITDKLTPLTQAVMNEDMAAVRAALENGANPDEIDPAVKHAPLHIAVTPGGLRNSDLVKLLAQYKVNLDSESAVTKLTPLMASMVVTEGGPFGVIERTKSSLLFGQLLDLGANPNAATQGGLTPLVLATELDNQEFVQKLIDKGAKVNAQDVNGQTALHAAYASGSSQALIEALRKAGALDGAINKLGKTPAEMRVTAKPASSAVAPEPVVAATSNPVVAAPVASSSSSVWSSWLIGGAAVAAAVVGGVVLAALVENQKKKNQAPIIASPVIGVTELPKPISGTCTRYELQQGTFPSVIDVTETWQTGGVAQWEVDNKGPHAWLMAAGLDPKQIFRVCNGKFFTGTYTRTVPTETASPYFSRVHTLVIANGVMTHTLRMTSPKPPDGNYVGVTLTSYASDYTYVSSYNITTGQYATSARGGQRAATVGPTGNTWSSFTTVVGGKTGTATVLVSSAP